MVWEVDEVKELGGMDWDQIWVWWIVYDDRGEWALVLGFWPDI
jgi:hypothetical protein